MNTEQEQTLREVQDQAVTHAIEEMHAAAELGLESKETRGDRFWLTKMATQSLTLAAKVEGFIMLRSREKGAPSPEDDETEARATDKLIKKARGEVAAILERARAGYKPRGSSDE
jgi:hypothetical protein